jgi:hypothetical protein
VDVRDEDADQPPVLVVVEAVCDSHPTAKKGLACGRVFCPARGPVNERLGTGAVRPASPPAAPRLRVRGSVRRRQSRRRLSVRKVPFGPGATKGAERPQRVSPQKPPARLRARICTRGQPRQTRPKALLIQMEPERGAVPPAARERASSGERRGAPAPYAADSVFLADVRDSIAPRGAFQWAVRVIFLTRA